MCWFVIICCCFCHVVGTRIVVSHRRAEPLTQSKWWMPLNAENWSYFLCFFVVDFALTPVRSSKRLMFGSKHALWLFKSIKTLYEHDHWTNKTKWISNKVMYSMIISELNKVLFFRFIFNYFVFVEALSPQKSLLPDSIYISPFFFFRLFLTSRHSCCWKRFWLW